MVKNFEFQYIFLFFFQKNENLLGYENFVDISWGHHKIRPVLRVISMYFRVFFK